MKKNHILILLHVYLITLWVEPRKEDVVNLAVLLPLPDYEADCLRETTNFAIQRINSIPDFISNDKIKYSLKAHFLKADKRDADFIDALYDIYDNGTKMLGGIGPPYEDKFSVTGDLCTLVFQSLLVAYKEILGDELRIEDFFFSSSPTINSGILAAREILDHFKWEKVGIIYDFASARYRKNVDNLRSILEIKNQQNKSVKILSSQGIWSVPPEYPVSSELNDLQKEGARIVFALVSIKGARKLFCEAFKRKMMKPKVVWILFERLPRGWASDIFSNNGKREVDCTDTQLLQASRGYISIVQQGIRSDNKTVIGNFSKDFYIKAIQKLTRNVGCDENYAYVYDAVWLLANVYRLFLQNTGRDLEIKTQNTTETVQEQLKKISVYRKFVSFEGITGPFRFDNKKNVPGVASRIGQISIWTHPSDYKNIHLGRHDTQSNILDLDEKINDKLFDRGIVTKHSAVENITYATIMMSMLITIWLITFLGVLMTLTLFLFTIVYSNDKTVMIESPLISCIILSGSLLSYLSIIIYGIDTYFISKEDIPKKCTGFLLMLSIGFTLTFGSFFAKAWRTYKLYMTPNVKVIHENDQASSKNIPDSTLCIIIAGFVVIDLIIFGIWIGSSPFQFTIVDISETQDLFADVITKVKRVECCSGNDTIFKIVMYCYKGVVLVFGLFLAIQNQNGKIEVPCDARQISMGIYNIFVVTLIGVISVILLPNAYEYQASYGIVASCIWICTTTTLLLIYFPKINLAIYSEKMKRAAKKENIKHTPRYKGETSDGNANNDETNSPNVCNFIFPIENPKKPLEEEPLPEFLNQYFKDTVKNEEDKEEKTMDETVLDESFTSNKDITQNIGAAENDAFEPDVELKVNASEDVSME